MPVAQPALRRQHSGANTFLRQHYLASTLLRSMQTHGADVTFTLASGSRACSGHNDNNHSFLIQDDERFISVFGKQAGVVMRNAQACLSHNYIGHNYIGHNYTGHKCCDEECAAVQRLGRRARQELECNKDSARDLLRAQLPQHDQAGLCSPA